MELEVGLQVQAEGQHEPHEAWRSLDFGISEDDIRAVVQEMTVDAEYLEHPDGNYFDDWDQSAPDLDNEYLWIDINYRARRHDDATTRLKRMQWAKQAEWDQQRRSNPYSHPNVEEMLNQFELGEINCDGRFDDTSQRRIGDVSPGALVNYLIVCKQLAETADSVSGLHERVLASMHHTTAIIDARLEAIVNGWMYPDEFPKPPSETHVEHGVDNELQFGFSRIGILILVGWVAWFLLN